MTQDETIQEALTRIDNHDWYWRMSDCNFTSNYNAAKASMKAFVRLVSTIKDAKIREALRSLWVLNYDDSRNRVNGTTTENYDALKAELMTAIAA